MLENIKALLDDAQKLRDKYGLIKRSSKKTAIGPDREDDLGASSALTLECTGGVDVVSRYSRFWRKFDPVSRPAPVAKFIWAIHDESNFGTLVDELRGLIDGLNSLSLIIPLERVYEHNKMIREDIESLKSLANFEDLEIVSVACSDNYPLWAKAASSEGEAHVLRAQQLNGIEKWNQEVGDDEGEGKGPTIKSISNPTTFVNNGNSLV